MGQNLLSIGGGNMGRAIIGGLIANGRDRSTLRVVEPVDAVRDELVEDFAIETSAELSNLDGVDVLLLAVKPQVMRAVVHQLAPFYETAQPLVVSIAAGITTAQLSKWLGGTPRIVRVMPNTPSLIGHGAAALYATANADAADRRTAEAILNAVGITQWVAEEQQLDAVTALSGSGPAYFFLILEIMERVGVELGLDADVAKRLAIETAHGAALLARDSSATLSRLREQVTSPGGTTERALAVLRDGDIEGLLRKALTAAHQRSRELAEASE